MIIGNYLLGNLRIHPSPGWLDVTSEMGDPNTPFTLAKADGVGALQFSIAQYHRGKLPDVTPVDLSELLKSFAGSRDLGDGFDGCATNDAKLICAMSFRWGRNFLRVWYYSNRLDIAQVTYVCEWGLEVRELHECSVIVNHLEFLPNE